VSTDIKRAMRNKKDRERRAIRAAERGPRTYESVGFKTWRRPKGAEYLASKQRDS
jgi:hypothetical protein